MEKTQEEYLIQISSAIQIGKAKIAKNLIEQALESGIDAQTIINESLMKAMEVITQSFSADIAFVPDVILASRAMNVATAVIEEHSPGPAGEPLGTVVAATVRGDLHDIGLNLVCMMFRNVGFLVYNMGCDVPADAVIRKAEEVNADIICISAMLTTTMPQIQGIVKLLENRRIRDKYCVMIGGAPVTERFAKRIGADIYTSDAVTAAKEAKKRILEKKRKTE